MLIKELLLAKILEMWVKKKPDINKAEKYQ